VTVPAGPRGSAGAAPARAERAEREPGERRPASVFFTVVGVVVVLALVVGGFYTWRVWSTLDDVQRDRTLLPSGAERPPADATAEGSFNYVLMGSDSRSTDDRGRSDVLMVAHVPPSHDRVYLISFPRDLWVEIPGRGYAKINAAYAYGGDQLTISTLESLVGVRMDHAARIDFEGFVGLTTALGGVTVYNRVPSSKAGYRWPVGDITIAGDEALEYVRQRYELPNGDLDRAERQRAVVKAILHKMLSLDVLANPTTFDALMSGIDQYVTFDEGITAPVLFTTAASMRVSRAEDIVSLQAPISGFGRSPDGQSIDLVDEARLAELAEAIRTGTMADYHAAYADQPPVVR